jgi:hypothetical protein
VRNVLNLADKHLYQTTRGFLTCCENLTHGASGFTSHPKEGVLRMFIALKIHRLGRF